jgi:epoxyqueuosine reductase
VRSATENTRFIKSQAQSLGFDSCGIARAETLNEDARRLENWLNAGMHAGMQYMANHFDLRVDPRKLVSGAKSVISLLLNYFPSEKQNEQAPQVAKYAYGKDYHEVIRSKLNRLLDSIRQNIGDIQGRGFVDSAPVLERSWAQKSGLGWVAKNTNLISKQNGSFFFIATLIVDLELDYDDPFAKDYCGSCTRCIDSCPTGAILPGKQIDANKCISYYTIELKEMLIPQSFDGKFENWAFGCDTCQDVCPWNRFSKPTAEEGFKPLPEVLNFTTKDWEEITEENFKVIFKDSPIKRSKFSGIRRNLNFLKH